MSGVAEQVGSSMSPVVDGELGQRSADHEPVSGPYASAEYVAEIQRKHPPVRELDALLGPELDWDAADQDEWDEDRRRAAAVNEEQRVRRTCDLGW